MVNGGIRIRSPRHRVEPTGGNHGGGSRRREDGSSVGRFYASDSAMISQIGTGYGSAEIRRSGPKSLKDEVGLPDIRHYVVSRFAILCDDSEIIPFTKLRASSARLQA